MLHVRDLVGDAFQLLKDLIDLRSGGQTHLFVRPVKMGRKRRLPPGNREIRVERPVLLRDEGCDLIFPVRDDAERDRLDAACRQAPLYFRPEKRRDLVADHAVEHAAGLLGVHEVHVDSPGVLERGLDRVLRDLVERDAAHLLLFKLEGRDQVPGDRLSLTVRVGCKIDLVRGLRGLAELG